MGRAGVGQGFVNALIRILQFDVFADHGDADTFARADHALDELGPVLHARRRRVELQRLANHGVEAFLLQHEGQFVDAMIDIARLDDGALGDVGKERQLFPHVFVERIFGAGYDDLRLQTDLAQFGHALLRGFRFQLTRRLDERHERYVDEQGVPLARLENVLADGFEERQAFDVARRAADLDDGHIGLALVGQQTDARFDFVGHMRDDLHGFAEVIATAFAGQDVFVNLSAGQVVAAAQHATGEAFVVSEVEIGLRSIVEHIDLTVLVRTHRARVDVEIRVELAHGHAQTTAFKQSAERSRGQSLPERTHHPARDKNRLHGGRTVSGRNRFGHGINFPRRFAMLVFQPR